MEPLDNQMEPILRQRVEDIVYEKLQTNIKEGVWKGGDKLPSENELCARLGVSRVSIRSAIQRLKALGLVEVKHGKGSFVAIPGELYEGSDTERSVNLTEKEFIDMTEFRQAIETKAVSIIAEKRGNVDLSRLETAYQSMKKAAKEGNEEEYSLQDYNFHFSILVASGNELFIQVANILKNQYYNYFKELNKFIFSSSGGNSRAVFNPDDENDAHTVLYEYLCKGNRDRAEEAANLILSDNKKRFMTYLREKDN